MELAILPVLNADRHLRHGKKHKSTESDYDSNLDNEPPKSKSKSKAPAEPLSKEENSTAWVKIGVIFSSDEGEE